MVAFVEAVVWTWEDLAASGIRLVTFYSSHKNVLSLFCPKEALNEIAGNIDDVAKRPGAARSAITSGDVGRALFHEAYRATSEAEFNQAVAQTLNDL